MIKRLMTMVYVSMLCLLCGLGKPEAAEKLRVVATLSVFSDLVKKVGGEFVTVYTVASPRFNPHFIEPKPSDVLRTSKADLFVHAGLDLESPWSDPLIEAAANRKVMPGAPGNLSLSRGITLLEVPAQSLSRVQGDIHLFGNPHYWLDPRNIRIMAEHIAEKLSEMDPNNAAAYQRNLSQCLSVLDAKIEQWKEQVKPVQGKEAIAYHNEWVYLAAFCGVKIGQFLEPKPGIPPTPRQLALLEGYIRQHGIRAIFQPTFYSKDAAVALKKRTGIKMYLLCVNVGETQETEDIIALFDYDVRTIVQALGNWGHDPDL